MTGHPAVEAAAVALLMGWDPLVFLRAEGVSREVAAAVLQVAQRLRDQERGNLAEAIGYHCAHALGQMFK